MGWLGSFLIIIGAWNLGRKRQWAFLITLSGGICWFAEGVRIWKPDLMFIEAVMGFVAIRNYIRWRNNE